MARRAGQGGLTPQRVEHVRDLKQQIEAALSDNRLQYAWPLLRQATAEGKGQAGSGRGALPQAAWEACCRGARPGEELDLALGEGSRVGDGSIPASARVSAGDAVPVVRAAARAAGAGRTGGEVRVEAAAVSLLVPDQTRENRWGVVQVLSWKRAEHEAVRLSGGWLPRPVLVQPPREAGACALGWAVAAWLQRRPGVGAGPSTRMGKLWPPRADEGAGKLEEPVVVRRSGEDGEPEGVAYGRMTARELVAVLLGDGPLVPDDEAAALAIARLEADALREREAGLRLDGEVEGIEAAWRHLGEQDTSRMCDERTREHKAELELCRRLRSCRSHSPEAVRARDKARAEGSRGKLESAGVLWLRVIERLAAADLEAKDAAAEAERWGGFAAAPAEDTSAAPAVPWAAAGREAARRLLEGEVAPGPWGRWALGELARRSIVALEKRCPARTKAGREALANLRAATGTAEDEVAEATRRAAGIAALAAVRVECDRRAGLLARVHGSVAAAARDWAGPAVARALGRGEVAVVADGPPRVLIGDAEALAVAGYSRLSREDGCVQVSTPRDSLGWAGAENKLLLTRLLAATAREVVAGRPVPGAAEVVALARCAGNKKRLPARWRPLAVPVDLVDQRGDPEVPGGAGELFPCEAREGKGGLEVRWREVLELASGERPLLEVRAVVREEDWDLELAREDDGRAVDLAETDSPASVADVLQDRALGVRDWLRAERERRSGSSDDDEQDEAEEDAGDEE